MESYENLRFESEVYFKLKEAEREALETNKRYSQKEVLRFLLTNFKDGDICHDLKTADTHDH